MKESYLAVAGRIRREVEQIEAVVDRAQDIWDGVDPDRSADHRIDAVALNLHGFYAGLERVFKTVAERIDLLMQRLPETAELVFEDLRAFAETLDRMASAE